MWMVLVTRAVNQAIKMLYVHRGCDPGYQGALCTKECERRTHGENCSLTCSEYCKGEDNSCDNVDGTCDQGCDPGYQGAQCRQ
ncbi:multiple epidermal growth factor-like domains 10, partial [Elysia marginata]